MVLKFRLISNEQDEFIRDFEILDKQTFFHFHIAIQDNLHFDKSQIASFFICSQDWEKELEITLFELTAEENAIVLVMDSTILSDHVSRVHDKLLYIFDVFNERLFFIDLVGTTDPVPGRKYPYCCFEQGPAPQQILMDRIFSSGKDDMEDFSFTDELFPDEGLDELDELDELGYHTLDDSDPDEE